MVIEFLFERRKKSGKHFLFNNKQHVGGRIVLFATSYMVGQENKRTNNRTMFPTLKNNAAAGYKGSVKIKLLKGTGLLSHGGEGDRFNSIV